MFVQITDATRSRKSTNVDPMYQVGRPYVDPQPKTNYTFASRPIGKTWTHNPAFQISVSRESVVRRVTCKTRTMQPLLGRTYVGLAYRVARPYVGTQSFNRAHFHVEIWLEIRRRPRSLTVRRGQMPSIWGGGVCSNPGRDSKIVGNVVRGDLPPGFREGLDAPGEITTQRSRWS